LQKIRVNSDVMIKKPLILVVEDEKLQLKALKIILEEKYDLLLAENGKEAVSHFKEYKGKIDLVLLDYHLPDFNAIEVVKQITDISYKNLPDIIITTTSNDPEMVIESMIQGLAYEFLVKPYGKPELITAIEKTLHRKTNEFEQKTQFLEKNDYIQKKMTELKTKQYENLIQQFNEISIQEQYNSLLRQVKIAFKNIPLRLILRILEDETGEIAPLPKAGKILVIEDEEPMLNALKILLEEHYEVYLAKPGQGGLDQLNSITDLDVVLLDIGLPDIRGDQILRLINEKKRTHENNSFLKCPDVVVLTAYSDEETIKNLCRNGATSYITKGEDQKIVLAILKKVIENRYYFKIISQQLTILKNSSFLNILYRKIKNISLKIFTEVNQGFTIITNVKGNFAR